MSCGVNSHARYVTLSKHDSFRIFTCTMYKITIFCPISRIHLPDIYQLWYITLVTQANLDIL